MCSVFRCDATGLIMREFTRKCKSFAFTSCIYQNIDVEIEQAWIASMIQARSDVWQMAGGP
jgi:hypothetical protein